MSMRFMVLAFATLGISGWAGTASADEPFSPEKFAELHALIKPDEGEWLWARIPWLTDVWQARKKAAAEGKPLLIWAGMGHPLGVT